MADADVGKRFLDYASKTGTKDDRTCRGCFNSLRSLQPIKIPTDLSDYKEMYGRTSQTHREKDS